MEAPLLVVGVLLESAITAAEAIFAMPPAIDDDNLFVRGWSSSGRITNEERRKWCTIVKVDSTIDEGQGSIFEAVLLHMWGSPIVFCSPRRNGVIDGEKVNAGDIAKENKPLMVGGRLALLLLPFR